MEIDMFVHEKSLIDGLVYMYEQICILFYFLLDLSYSTIYWVSEGWEGGLMSEWVGRYFYGYKNIYIKFVENLSTGTCIISRG